MAKVYVDDPDFAAGSEQFFALSDKYRTSKWLFADLAYVSASLGGIASTLGLFKARIWRTSPNRALTLAVFVVAYPAFFLGSIVSAVSEIERGLVPPWADSLGVPMLGAMTGFILCAAPAAGLLLWPLVRGRVPSQPLGYVDTAHPLRSIISNIAYCSIVMFLLFLALGASTTAGSWLLTPACLALAWLALNARVVAIAPKPAKR